MFFIPGRYGVKLKIRDNNLCILQTTTMADPVLTANTSDYKTGRGIKAKKIMIQFTETAFIKSNRQNTVIRVSN